eukprot:5921077-Amphidinium_carterae.3
MLQQCYTATTYLAFGTEEYNRTSLGRSPQDAPDELSMWSDTEHASCVLTRRSTSGCVVAHGNVIYHYSVTQFTASGESEYNGLTKAALEGLGQSLQAIIRELGEELPLKVYVDSATSLGMARRVGLGKVKHLEIKQLWAWYHME